MTGSLSLAHEDVQALVAFLGDCPDVAVLEDVGQCLATMLATGSFVGRPLAAVCQVSTLWWAYDESVVASKGVAPNRCLPFYLHSG